MVDLRTHPAVEHTPFISDQPSIVKYFRLPSTLFAPAADFGSVLLIPAVGSLLRQTIENLQRNVCFWTVLALCTVVLVASHGGYRSGQAETVRKRAGLAIKCFLATALAMLSMSLALGHAHILLRHWTFVDLALTPFVMASVRACLVSRVIKRQDEHAVRGSIVICSDRYPPDLDKALSAHLEISRVLGVLYLSDAEPPGAPHPWKRMPDRDAFLKALHAFEISDVIFVHHPELDAYAPAVHQQLLPAILAYPTRIWIAFDLASNLPEMAKGRYGACRLVPVVSDDLVSSANVLKRMVDLIGSIGLLIIFAPLLIISSVLVAASSRGPVVFRQTRTGAHGKRFTVLKFRTMVNDPHRAFAQATPNDPRVTRIGRFMRRTSLDELLQLFNVIAGEMSLVGPRPHAPETQVEGINFENAVKLYQLRHRVKPGITGLAQIRGQRGETREIGMLEQRLASDLEYIQSWSLWLDISILLQTIPVMIVPKNAC